jgi:CheY-like chemotaxis protein/anti-sigma regulatory factor (Ser/Thr protein kinase)
LGAFIPSNIEIHENFAEKIHFISADPAQIKQITANLCTNAFNAIGQNKGIIEISLANEDIKEPVLIGDEILSAGDYVKLVIKDSGAGIDPQSQKKIFDPYFTTKNMGIEKGRGLGLAVVYGIVKAHKGAVKIESSLGKGTTFQIYFPAVAIVEISASASQKDIYIGSEKILFVDDEEMLTDVASQMLSKLGHKVETSNSPAEALNKFKENNSQYKLIITDMSMPEMPGDVLAKKIASIRSDIPIIICSGYIIDFDKLRVENPNVKAVILKPLQRREMEEVISSVLENKDIKDSRILGF